MDASALPLFYQHLLSQLASPPHEMRRLFHGRGRRWTGLEQLTADWLDGQVLISLFKEQDADFLAALTALLQDVTQTQAWQRSGAVSLLVQHRDRVGSPMEVIWGELQTWQQVTENGLKFQLDLGQKQNNGLFLDMRYGRQWVRDAAKDSKVLNLFAYTCGFSVAAIAGGAEHVVNLDMAKAALGRGRDNHRLNGHDLSKVSFLGHDIFKSWGKLKKYGPYDLIIIDPPSFQKGSFALTKDYAKILRRLPDMLTAEGKVLACVNSPAVSPQFLIDGMAEEAPELTFIERLDNPPEFADLEHDSALKAMVFAR
ncbi:class I SAM-dependent methyltransferase [Photobacterium sp. WH77]|uniref:class I SAM-dependent methyltransferase n=1 Tax=unclassified Photobacterium TaxID=2628852 RepID=UPI001EDA6C45|nr:MULTISPECIES: class I SAM-dependent methyltransferase [unclassified Photobacterium]MCG2835971.1 class I SAM-dependent methyltransferase [Photobacterium sp. WH77]MCG2843352.1 class I SAM-dependent methyltransferase [Photobacterium sp. WH80]